VRVAGDFGDVSRLRAIPARFVVLALIGVVALESSFAVRGGSRVGLSGPDVPLNPGSREQADINANNSPTLAQNPRRPENLALVNRIDTPAYSGALQVSRDRGAHRSRTAVPIPPGEEPKCYAPNVTFAADGTLHMSYVTLRGTGNRPTRSGSCARRMAARRFRRRAGFGARSPSRSV